MKKERGFSLIELLIVVAIIGIIAAIAIPNLLKSRQAANAASAASSMRTFTSAQATYQATAGQSVDFATDLTELGAEGHIDSLLTAGFKSGYTFAMTGVDAVGPPAPVPSYWDATAAPSTTGNFGTGNNFYYVNEAGVIWQDLSSTSGGGGAIAVPAFPTRSLVAAGTLKPLD